MPCRQAIAAVLESSSRQQPIYYHRKASCEGERLPCVSIILTAVADHLLVSSRPLVTFHPLVRLASSMPRRISRNMYVLRNSVEDNLMQATTVIEVFLSANDWDFNRYFESEETDPSGIQLWSAIRLPFFCFGRWGVGRARSRCQGKKEGMFTYPYSSASRLHSPHQPVGLQVRSVSYFFLRNVKG